ncbi:unnamed protein product, partial [Prorocentrum cordatum]
RASAGPAAAPGRGRRPRAARPRAPPSTAAFAARCPSAAAPSRGLPGGVRLLGPGRPPRPGEGGARPGAVRRGLRGLALRAPRRAAWHLREAGRLAAVAHGVPERRRAAAPGGGRAAVVPVGRSEGLHGGAGDAVGPARSEASRASAPRAADRRRRRPIGGGCLGVARRGGAPRRCAVLRGITACADDCGRSALRLA